MQNGSSSLLLIIKNTGSTVFVKGIIGVARVVLLLLIARKFGPADFGRLSLALSVVALFRVSADLGIDTVLIRQFSINKIPVSKLLSNGLVLKLGTGTAGYIASALFFWTVYSTMEALDLLFVLSTTIYTTLLINAFVSYYQAKLRMADILASHVISAVVYVLLTLLGLSMDWSLVALCLIMPVSELFNFYLINRTYRKSFSLSFSFDRKMVRLLLSEGLPVALSNMMVVTYMRLDQLMLGWFKGETAVGEYAAAFRITEPFMLIFTSLSLSLYASLSEDFSDPQGKRGSTAFKVIGPTMIATLAIASLLSLLSKDLMSLISKAYFHSAEVLMILSWSILFKAVNAQLTAVINSRGLYKVITLTALANLLVNIALNLLLIPRYGTIGAAVAVLITESINTIVQSSYVATLLKHG